MAFTVSLKTKRNCIGDKSLKIINLTNYKKCSTYSNTFDMRKYNFLRTYTCNTNLANLRAAALSLWQAKSTGMTVWDIKIIK